MMADRHATDTMERSLKEHTIQEFKASLRGTLSRSGNDSYEEARKVWNDMIDKRPALIVRCTGVTEVINAVNFARDYDLLLAIRAGGHNVAGTAVCDGGIELNARYKLRVTELTLAPGGHVGEHNHGGAGIRLVTAGSMTYADG
jgi:FAD binding domain